MDPVLRDLICDVEWTHAHGQEFTITFNQDGTGELLAIGEMGLGWLFALSMQWKPIPISRSTTDIIHDVCFTELKHTNILTRRPMLLGSARLEIQLSPIAPEREYWTEPHDLKEMNECILSEAAYLPREFTVVVEKGNFAAVRDHAGRRELRMTFDKSPYPPLEAYSQQKRGGPSAGELHRWLGQSKSFYAGKPSDELLTARAAEDDTLLGYHVSACVML